MQTRSNRKFNPAWLLLLALFVAAPASATKSDVGKESRWAEQVIEGLLDGDAAWLDDGNGHQFLGIFSEAGNAAGRAVVLVHGIGAHPNWADVIYPLRDALVQHEITSLSVQMPILANDADPLDYVPLFDEVASRLNAAIDYLKDAGYNNIAIASHSMGSSMVAHYLSQESQQHISGWVAIGMGPGLGNTAINNLAALESISLPILDLYGSADLEHVLASAKQRAAAAQKQAGHSYRQVRVEGANHFFQGREAALGQAVLEWLDRHAK